MFAHLECKSMEKLLYYPLGNTLCNIALLHRKYVVWLAVVEMVDQLCLDPGKSNEYNDTGMRQNSRTEKSNSYIEKTEKC